MSAVIPKTFSEVLPTITDDNEDDQYVQKFSQRHKPSSDPLVSVAPSITTDFATDIHYGKAWNSDKSDQKVPVFSIQCAVFLDAAETPSNSDQFTIMECYEDISSSDDRDDQNVSVFSH